MAYLNLNPKPKQDTRMLAIGLAVLAAALLVVAGFSRTWLARPSPEVGFGPLGCTKCSLPWGTEDLSNSAFVEKMREMAPAAAKEISSAFVPMGYATFGLSLLGAAALLVAAGLALGRRRPALPMSPASVALLGLLGALLAGCVFVATKPGGPGFVGVSLGFWIFSIGNIVGIAAGQMLAKQIRPVDPDLLADSMNPDAY